MSRSTRARPRAVGLLVRTHVILLLLASVVRAGAQTADAPPGDVARVAVAGEVTATYGSEDPGFFNYATYDYSPLRNVRVVIDSSVRVIRHLEVLGQLRTDGLTHAQVSALYVRVRPWTNRDVDLQVGRVPPTFGLLEATGYGAANPLVSRPLAYGYLTSLRTDAVPRLVADLLAMRGGAGRPSILLATPRPSAGCRSATPSTGTRPSRDGSTRSVQGIAAVTVGSLANPRVEDDNDGRSLQGRVILRPHPAIAIGASGARGAYLAETLDVATPAGRSVESYRQDAVAVDLTLSSGRWAVRGELIRTWSSLPAATDPDSRRR